MGKEEHQKDYVSDSWMQYSIYELGAWVHLLTLRAFHRSNSEKKRKDLHDAKNYLGMIEDNLKSTCVKLGIDYNTL